MKTCTKCGESKSPSDFYKNRAYKDGSRSECKSCGAMFPSASPEQRRAKATAYRAANPEKTRMWVRAWRARNKERANALTLAWYRANTPRLRAAAAARKKSNPLPNRLHARNRRAMVKNALGTHTINDIVVLYEKQFGKCAICHVALGMNYDVDHVLPLKLGGGNDKDNLQLLCRACNRSKGAKHPVDFMRSKGLLL